MTEYKQKLIELMATSGVLMFGEFTTKSGRQTPYFVNSGNYNMGAEAEMLSEYYAALIAEKLNGKFDALFGPAYKGIPLCTLAASALYRNHGINVGYCFNRKEAKTHGEGGMFVGWQPKNGDRFVITEDVISAGTAVREILPLIKSVADVSITDMVISVDRMERGQNNLTAVEEMKKEFGITVHPIVTIVDIIAHLHNREVQGKIYIDDAMREKMEAYRTKYCAL
jgi:orotate phosphoribosyltransferase